MSAMGAPVASTSYSSVLPSASTSAARPLLKALESPPVDRNCQLFGPVSLVIQLSMGVVVVSALLLKRARERPKRPWRIWMFDVSKQCIGQFFVHGLNVALSSLISHYSHRRGHRINACSLYFLNVLIDVTLGVAILWGVIKGVSWLLVHRLGKDDFASGHYGQPPRWKAWGKQLAVYVLAISVMKIAVVALIAGVPVLVKVGDWLLSWLPSTDAQIAFVVLVFPVLANAAQFMVIDSLIKGRSPTFSLLHGDDDPEYEAAPGLESSDEHDGNDSIASAVDKSDDLRRRSVEVAAPDSTTPTYPPDSPRSDSPASAPSSRSASRQRSHAPIPPRVAAVMREAST